MHFFPFFLLSEDACCFSGCAVKIVLNPFPFCFWQYHYLMKIYFIWKKIAIQNVNFFQMMWRCAEGRTDTEVT